MVIKNKYVVVGAIMAGAAAAVGVRAIVRAVRRRKEQVIPSNVRKLMVELMKLQGEDYLPQKAPGGGLGKSIFFKRIEKLDDKQLMALFAVVEVGYFLKASGIDPLHPTKEQLKQSAAKYSAELRGAPTDRAALLGELDTTDAHDALAAAFNVLKLA